MLKYLIFCVLSVIYVDAKCKGYCHKPHEYYDSCSPTCPSQTCQSINQTYFCPRQPSVCRGACCCIKGYYRDETERCILKKCCPPVVGNTDSKDDLDRGAIALSGEFINQLSQSSPDENFVTSATSIMIPLAQLALFAKNVVLQQLLNILNLRTKDDIKRDYSILTPSYRNQKKVEFNLATKYFFNENYELSDDFQTESEKYFNARGENVDFGQNVEAADTINEYVANVTHNRIQNLVSPDSLNSDTVVVLVNAIYFLGNWVHQFNPNDTEKRNFTKRNNDVVQLDTMYQENTFKYTENSDLKIQALEMPYVNDNFSLFVILPEIDAFDGTIQALRNPDNFLNIRNSLKNQKVQVFFPKMYIQTAMDMAEMLQKDHLTEMFKPNANGFQGILKNEQPLYISSAVQKAFMKVDETGTEAAAATAVVITTLSLPPTFKADHPYLFYIIFERSILFCGAFVG